MDIVGVIESVEYVNLRNNDPIPGLERVVLLFVSTGNSSASTFVSTINRIYPIEFDHRRASLALQRLPPISYEDFVLQDPSFVPKLEVLLEAYCAAANNSTLRRELAQQTIHLLQLSKDLLDLGPEISRFSIARNNAEQRHKRGSDQDEPICKVKCQCCGESFLFRLDLRTTAAVGARVYRIPGLAYSETVENGVGLVVQDNCIVGRMTSGIPACSCSRTEYVRII
jgi:hypothetical protein